ncbi:dihydrolipoyl dehydrogenase [Desulforhabdus amnigena]|uniref:Dihydrolipoyl dehydrogenase n=1 Tax=Desulforhabdus amnigena TaxID=40218 RepID=A0A9W6D6S4_9BACT|nr:dihydrolipoyl dehydrogenase [Desulforhabdus amnigena]NLJ28254.1 dihydrolipoyl dehydrogenase [Deltaproteobacteria bacterium]GLI34826.1 dihydrolipoyl dehydrogenase [Desulforhabdus amnigena]
MGGQDNHDLIVIGAGPGGYVASVRAAQLGFKVACVEKDPHPGGVCLNVGCIPSKALLDSTEYYHLVKERLAEHGIQTGEATFDLGAMMSRKEQVVRELTESVRNLLEGNGVEIVRGVGRLASEDTVEVMAGEKSRSAIRKLRAGKILLAAGSEPISIPSLPFDGVHIITSTEALALDTVPGHLGIVGGGYIGLELGSVWRRLGAQVTVIEMLPRIASTLDAQVGRALERALGKQGFSFHFKTKVTEAHVEGGEVRLTLDSEGQEKTMTCDRLLVAVGRRPLTRGLGLEELGMKLTQQTRKIWVDGQYRTSIPSIYAIGDLIDGPMLAHKASAEGIAAVECMAGLPGEVNYDAIPAVVYTSPEVAGVGLTEEEVKSRGVEYRVGTFPFAGNSRARSLGEKEGFAKVIAHAKTDRLLGVHVIGPRASELIAECVVAIEFNAKSADIARVVHGHPTLSETLHEAAMAARKSSLRGS